MNLVSKKLRTLSLINSFKRYLLTKSIILQLTSGNFHKEFPLPESIYGSILSAVGSYFKFYFFHFLCQERN